MTRDCRRLMQQRSIRNDLWTMHLFEAPDAKEIAVASPTPWSFSADFSPDGLTWSCGNGGGDIVSVWETQTGKKIHEFRGHKGYLQQVAFSPDGKRLASSAWDGTVRVWDLVLNKPLITFRQSGYVWHVAFCPTGEWLGASSGPHPDHGRGPGELKVWNLTTAAGFDLGNHPQTIYGVAVSPDGRYVAVGQPDGTASVWEVQTRSRVSTHNMPGRRVKLIAFSPDGRLVATAGEKETSVKLWETATGSEVGIFTGLPDQILFVQFSPKGRWLYAGSESHLKCWPVPKPPGSAPARPG